MSRLLDKGKRNVQTGEIEYPFKYNPSHSTDISKTFERARKQQSVTNIKEFKGKRK